ncbi:ketopantoate reductase family protein [Chengkuizengella axinellae]|uniref:2-dehydropantoate 2-reductase n=1 Tax=Chengkuizengella axinellae TaxID=3064388 RepID=A0ABT9IUW9_9BACL|nr:2-dehydropantoate 2-reductase [Chengkuizengella sp. 2205SS18-9]MDP5273141.1 2-dehydropantoate 2-reductase [Chengkuizengella sp. 2205SS18-9]
MRFCIVGGGSLGLLLAAKYTLANIPVVLITRTKEQAKIIRNYGLQLKEGNNEHAANFTCYSMDEMIAKQFGFHFDWIFLMVKQHHINLSLAQNLLKLMSKHTNLLCFQNGIGHDQKLSEVISSDKIYMAVTTEAAKKSSDRKVIHTGKGYIWTGQADSKTNFSRENEKKLVKSLSNAGFNAKMTNNMSRIIWNKLLINSVINPLTAILNVPNGKLLTSSNWLQLMKDLFEEGKLVANKSGIIIEEQLWDQLIEVCHKTASNSSSMLQDVLAGRETEIDMINGSLIRLALNHQIEVPNHQAIYHMVKGLTVLKSNH